jgi:DNA-binding NarL/FixJ family response regulator
MGEPPTRRVTEGHSGAKHLEIGGTGYYVRSELQGQASDTLLILVAIERCPTELPSQRELRRAFGLTPRETLAALLLADRKSNREIAEELSVTEHTARRHTEKVLLKLGIHRRTEVRRTLTRYRSPAGDVADRGGRSSKL